MSKAEKLRRFAQRLAAMLMAIFRAIFGGVREAGSMLVDDARSVGRTVAAVGGPALRGVGAGLQLPFRALDGVTAAVGNALSSLLPTAAPTAQSIADDAVASDATSMTDGPAVPRNLGPTFLHAAAEALRRGGRAELRPYAAYVPENVQEWLASLSPHDLDVAIKLDPAVLWRHAFAERSGELTPLLPAPLHMQPDANADIAAMRAKAMANFAASKFEAAAMATRGPRPVPARVEVDEPGAYARPAFH